MGDDAVDRKGNYSFIDGVRGRLPPFEAVEGKPLGGDLFPRIWPR